MADLVIFGAADIGRLAHVDFTTERPRRVAAFKVDASDRGDSVRVNCRRWRLGWRPSAGRTLLLVARRASHGEH
jgi:hypothetical protein